jgi:hypothetical protein
MKTFEVRVTKVVTLAYQTVVTVQADDDEHAIEMAEDAAHALDTEQWEADEESDSEEISVDVDSVDEQTEVDPTKWCDQCGARNKADCGCGPLAEND